MGRLLADVTLAWQLLSAIPLPAALHSQSRLPGRAAAWFPLVGLLLGGLLAGLNWLCAALGLPPGVTAALLLLLWVGFTGLLHLDGLMDACDGLLPPRAPERRLEIMKDSRVGAFGVVGAVLLLLLKYSALADLSLSAQTAALLLPPTLGRWSMTWLMVRYPPARAEGLAVFFRQGLGWPQVVPASAVAGLTAVGLLGVAGLLLWLLAWLVATLPARLAQGRLGGLTGDIYGAGCELVEAALLLALVGLA